MEDYSPQFRDKSRSRKFCFSIIYKKKHKPKAFSTKHIETNNMKTN